MRISKVEEEIKKAMEYLNSDESSHIPNECREMILKFVQIAKEFETEWKNRYVVAEDNVRAELASTNDSCLWCEKIVKSQTKSALKELVRKESLVNLIIRAACNGYAMDDRSDAEELAEFLSTEIKNMIDDV